MYSTSDLAGKASVPGIPTVHTALLPTLHELAETLGNAVDAKDGFTWRHSEGVADASRTLARALGLGERVAELVHLAGHLHDIGKIAVPDAILGKPGPLTAREFDQIKRHPERGAAIVRPVRALSAPGGVADMILAHHERWDGSGYPFGTSGTAIPLGARIIAVADSLSAMTQQRPYKKAMPFNDAAHEIVRNSGKLYDPAVVQVFIRSCCTVRKDLGCHHHPPCTVCTPHPDTGEHA